MMPLWPCVASCCVLPERVSFAWRLLLWRKEFWRGFGPAFFGPADAQDLRIHIRKRSKLRALTVFLCVLGTNEHLVPCELGSRQGPPLTRMFMRSRWAAGRRLQQLGICSRAQLRQPLSAGVGQSDDLRAVALQKNGGQVVANPARALGGIFAFGRAAHGGVVCVQCKALVKDIFKLFARVHGNAALGVA